MDISAGLLWKLVPKKWREKIEDKQQKAVDKVVSSIKEKGAVTEDVMCLLGIEDMRIEKYSFIESPLSIDQVKANYKDEWIELPEHLSFIRDEMIEDCIRDAKSTGKLLENDGSYSLRNINISRPSNEFGERDIALDLTLYPTDYFNFIFPNRYLGKPIKNYERNREETIRDICGLGSEKLYLDKLNELPFHFKVGINTLVLTADDYLVVTVRSDKTQVAPGEKGALSLHVSAHEGMFRCKETDTSILGDQYNGSPHPFSTSIRSLDKELNLKVDRDFALSDLSCLGVFLDVSRAQPYVPFILKLKKLSVRQLLDSAREAPDAFENESIFGVKWNVEYLTRLYFEPRIEYLEQNKSIKTVHKDDIEAFRGRTIKFASNHAQFGYFCALKSEFGNGLISYWAKKHKSTNKHVN